MKYGRLGFATAIAFGLHGVVLSYPIQKTQIAFEQNTQPLSVSLRLFSAPQPTNGKPVLVEKKNTPEPNTQPTAKPLTPLKETSSNEQKISLNKAEKKGIPVKEQHKKPPEATTEKQIVKKAEIPKATRKQQAQSTTTIKSTERKKSETETVAKTMQEAEKNRPSPTTQSTSMAASKPNKPKFIEKPRFKVKPKTVHYPRIAKKKGWQGLSIIEIWVNEHGEQIKQVITDSSGHKILDDAALSAVAKWQLERQTEDGQGLAYRVQIPIHFQLK